MYLENGRIQNRPALIDIARGQFAFLPDSYRLLKDSLGILDAIDTQTGKSVTMLPIPPFSEITIYWTVAEPWQDEIYK